MPLIYLDNAASSQKPLPVIQAMTDYYQNYHANVHRGIHRLSEEATNRYEGAREKVARFINAPDASQIIWLRNATEGFNLVAYTWGRVNIQAGDEILLTEMEHHANLVPWQMLAEEKGAVLRFIPFKEDGTLDLTDLSSLLTEKTKLFSFTAMSNVFGTITPVKELVKAGHDVGAVVMIDAAQSVPHHAG